LDTKPGREIWARDLTLGSLHRRNCWCGVLKPGAAASFTRGERKPRKGIARNAVRGFMKWAHGRGDGGQAAGGWWFRSPFAVRFN
jgi:hypothetical protein